MNDTFEITRVSVPANPRYARVVRMLAANLATVDGLSIDEVEDVRMAAEEAFVYSLATGLEGEINIEFHLSEDELVMEFPVGSVEASDDGEEPALVYAAFILEAVCDKYELTDSVLRLSKRHGVVDGN